MTEDVHRFPDGTGFIEFTASAEEAGSRVDIAVARRAHATRSEVSTAAHAGRLLIDGRAVKPSTPLVAGGVVRAMIPERIPLSVAPENIPLEIIFEDETLLVVNKAAGMVTHPAHGSPEGTLVNGLLAHVGALPGDPVRAGLVHRLDRDTSGLLLVAKTPEALATLGRAMQKRYITREYLGLVTGIPQDEAGLLEGSIGRDPRNRVRYAVRSDGKPAVTHFRIHERLKGAAELHFHLETGRTHQIRVHLAAYGHPIVNDALYGRGDRRSPLPGQALHAWHLSFKHPKTAELLHFEAPPSAAYLATKKLFI